MKKHGVSGENYFSDDANIFESQKKKIKKS